MTNEEYSDNIFRAETFMYHAVGQEFYFWKGYIRGLLLQQKGEEFESEFYWNDEESEIVFVGRPDSMSHYEFQGYQLGFDGKTAHEALAIGKQGTYRAGFNHNYHKDREDGDLNNIGIVYRGKGRWKLPPGATITFGERDPGQFLGVRDGGNWVLKLADSSEWVLWSEDIPGIWGPPWDSD